MSADGDYQFGQGSSNFLVNSPACVAQSVQTRLALWQGDWFLDVTEGTPWREQVLGKGRQSLRDLAIQSRILETPGVTSIQDYQSQVDPITRLMTVTVVVNTEFGLSGRIELPL